MTYSQDSINTLLKKGCDAKTIQKVTGASRATIWRLTHKSKAALKAAKRVGKWQVTKASEKRSKSFIAHFQKLQKREGACSEVTSVHAWKGWRPPRGLQKPSARTCQNYLLRAGWHWRRCREGVLLTPSDKEERVNWAKKHSTKKAIWWKQSIFLDCTSVPIQTTRTHVKNLAGSTIRGSIFTFCSGLALVLFPHFATAAF
jgi:hypothetical protein